MQKTKLGSDIKYILAIDSSHKIPPRFITRKFRQITVKRFVREIYAKNEMMVQNQKPFWN